MGSLLERVYKTISEVFMREVKVETEQPKYKRYPFKEAWKGHNESIDYVLQQHVSFLSHPTGSGKTAIFLTAAVESGLKTMVIEPRNALQEQVAKYEVKIKTPILYLFERSKHCNKKPNEKAQPPCIRRFKKFGKWYFKLNDQIVEFPCDDCPYEERKSTIKELFGDGDCIAVMNQGNFWILRNQAEFVIIDEMDETLRSITDAVSYPRRYESDDPVEVLEWMKSCITEDIDKVVRALEIVRNDDELEKLNRVLQSLERKLRKVEFFMNYPPEKLITYIKGKSTYVEVFDEPMNVVKKLFPDAKICLVTATPPKANGVKRIEHYIPFRARVIYAPIGNLSVRNVFKRGNIHLLERAAEFIIKTYDYTIKLTGMRKAPIHCGNLARHGIRIYEILKANGQKVLLMEEGRQKEYVDKFIEGDYDFFCAVAVEYGYDWGFSPIQYILKVPYADQEDPRIKAIRKLLGDEKFNEWYEWDALSRLIQACGRNARSPNDFGITIILDSCFERVYKRFEDRVPKWFKDRLIWLGGNDGEEG